MSIPYGKMDVNEEAKYREADMLKKVIFASMPMTEWLTRPTAIPSTRVQSPTQNFSLIVITIDHASNIDHSSNHY